MIPIQKLKLQIPNIFVYKCLETGLKFGFQVPELSPFAEATGFSQNAKIIQSAVTKLIKTVLLVFSAKMRII